MITAPFESKLRKRSIDPNRLKLDDDRSMRWMIGDGRAIVLRREY